MHEELEQLTLPLLMWYQEHKRDLPWRNDPQPYRVWVSEIMLQQTRVAAVLDYYRRFMDALPTVEDLAEVPEDALMKLWQGLGYYSRARNLQKAAKMVAERGVFPDTYEGLLALPGVGDYTASAIASAAFGRREAAVDGNVLRVVMRIADCGADIAEPKVKAAVRGAVQAVMPEKAEEIRIFNQAMMELGATVCGPNGEPKCGVCPAQDFCLACAHGTAMALPVKKAKKARRAEEKTVYVLVKEGKVALRQRGEGGLLAGLWEFPNVPGTLEEQDAPGPLKEWGLVPKAWKKKLTAKHIFTHVEWHMTGYVLEVEGEGPFLWADAAELTAHAVPSAFGKFYAEAQRALAKED